MKKLTALDLEKARRAYEAAIDTGNAALIAVAQDYFKRCIEEARVQ